MKRILFMVLPKVLVSFLILCSFTIDEKPVYKSIEALINSKTIDATFKSLGGHQENCVEAFLTNNTNDTLKVEIEAGRRLVAVDEVYQDILIVKAQKLKINPLSKIKTLIYGFCCQNHDRSPKYDSEFTVGYLAPKDWIKLAEVVNKNNLPADAVQHAVWCMSDNVPLSAVSGATEKETNLLRKTVASLKGIQLPWYNLSFAKDTSRLFSDRPQQITGEINYYVRNNSVVTINIRDKKGAIKSTLMQPTPVNPGSYTCSLNLNVLTWLKGDYEVLIYTDETLNTKKVFTL